MLDLMPILSLQEPNLTHAISLDEMNGLQPEPLNFMDLLAEIVVDSHEIEMNITENRAVSADPDFTEFKEDLPVNMPISESEEVDVIEIDKKEVNEDIEQNHAMVWINFPDFQPPIPLHHAVMKKDELEEVQPFMVENKNAKKNASEKTLIPNATEIAEVTEINEFETTKIKDTEVNNDFIFSNQDIEEYNIGLNKENPISLIQENPTSPSALMALNAGIKAEQQTFPTPPLSPPQNITIPIDTQAPEWGKHFNQQIVWLGQQSIKSAVIKLHPQELGPLEINVSMTKTSASLNIASHSADVRELIGQALPELREMMAEQGVNLLEVNIGTQSEPRHSNPQDNFVEMSENITDNPKVNPTQPTQGKIAVGLVDYFA